MNILCIQYRQIGDVLMCTPALRLLRKSYPDAKISFVVDRIPYPVLKYNPNIDEIIMIKLHKDSFFQQLHQLQYLRKQRYDIVIDFLNTPRSAIMSRFTGARKRVAFLERGRKYLHNINIPPPEGIYYRAQKKMWLLKPLGVQLTNDILPDIYTSDNEKKWAQQTWETLGLKADDFVVAISPVSKVQKKIWPLEDFAFVCDRLISETHVKILFTHGKGEEHYISSIINKMRHKNVLIAPLGSLLDFKELLGLCSLFIGNDNGPRHIAIAAGIPTLGIFVASKAKHWTPPDMTQHKIIEAGMNGRFNIGQKDKLTPTIVRKQVLEKALKFIYDIKK